MADIKTIFRELSVILGYILSKYKLTFAEDFIDMKTYLDFIRRYCKNIDECNSEVQKIEELDEFIVHQGIIANGLRMGKMIYEKLNLDGDIYWLGAKTKSQYPFDIRIGDVGISLKEDSYILKNPSFASYLNALIQPNPPFKNVHVFRKFALDEFTQWYNYTYKALFKEYNNHELGNTIFSYDKRGTFIRRGPNGLIFGSAENEIEVKLEEDLDEVGFNKRLGGFLFEHTVSKWIKDNLERKNPTYEQLKKDCSLKAGLSLKELVIKELNLDSDKILELFQIYENPYYYGKSFGTPHLYRVPSKKECKIDLVGVEVSVPQSQLNVLFSFQISNVEGANTSTFRVECRYSHGQFKGVPEAKLYYTDTINHLQRLYHLIA